MPPTLGEAEINIKARAAKTEMGVRFKVPRVEVPKDGKANEELCLLLARQLRGGTAVRERGDVAAEARYGCPQ